MGETIAEVAVENDEPTFLMYHATAPSLARPRILLGLQ
jgi:hypothetical protein